MPTLFLIRHGENDFVKKGRLAGRLPDVHLNENGLKQALKAAEILCDVPFKAVYSSPMERAMETAQPLAAALNLPVHPHSGLTEIDFGAWQGRSLRQLARTKLWKVVQMQPSAMRFPDGESFGEAQQRAVAAVEEICAAVGEDEIAAAFAHGDIIKLIIAHFLSMPLDAFQRVSINTASFTILNMGKHGANLFMANYIAGMNFKPPDPKKRRSRRAEPPKEAQP